MQIRCTIPCDLLQKAMRRQAGDSSWVLAHIMLSDWLHINGAAVVLSRHCLESEHGFAVFVCIWRCRDTEQASPANCPGFLQKTFKTQKTLGRKPFKDGRASEKEKSLSNLRLLKRRRPDLNRCVLVLQTIALPLGYCAIYSTYSV